MSIGSGDEVRWRGQPHYGSNVWQFSVASTWLSAQANSACGLQRACQYVHSLLHNVVEAHCYTLHSRRIDCEQFT